MVSPITIDNIRSASSIVEVLSGFISLKQKGKSWHGRCPFHNEKTPSFVVTPSMQIYKCFGCGEGGDVISFLMKQQGNTFTEALEWLAEFYSIPMEYEQGYSREEIAEQKSKEKVFSEMLAWVQNKFVSNLKKSPEDGPVWGYLENRHHDAAFCEQWGIGYARDDWQGITNSLIEQGWYDPAIEIGLIQTGKKARSYDMFRNRITFPIYNQNGVITGFSGRLIAGEGPKYLNSAESELFVKGNSLLGWKQAMPSIKTQGFAYLVEGNFDVSTFHRLGAENTVAPCGTALTDSQARLLKRITNHIVIVGDADGSGQAAMGKAVDIFIGLDMRCEVVTLPEGEDPDSWALGMGFEPEEKALSLQEVTE